MDRTTTKPGDAQAPTEMTDRQRWASARTLADLGVLTGWWLEGYLGHHPGYVGPPDEETTDLIPTLARVNYAGFVTTSSQPGVEGPGYDGANWAQRAAVEGLTDPATAAHLRTAADRQPGLIFIEHQAARARDNSYDHVVEVTVRDLPTPDVRFPP